MDNTELLESNGWQPKVVTTSFPEKTSFFAKGNYGIILDERQQYNNFISFYIWIKDPALHADTIGSNHTYGSSIAFAFKGQETIDAIETLLGIVEN